MRKVTGAIPLHLATSAALVTGLLVWSVSSLLPIARIAPRISSSLRPLIFLRDNTVSIGLTMIVMFLVITALPSAVALTRYSQEYYVEFASNPQYAGLQHLGDLLNIGTETTTNWIVRAFTRGLSFAGGASFCPVSV